MYFNIERQLGKLAKVTAFLENKQKIHCGSISAPFAGSQASANADVLVPEQADRARGKESAFVRAKSGKAAFAASPGAVK